MLFVNKENFISSFPIKSMLLKKKKRNRARKAYKNITKEENKRKTQRDNKLLKIIYKNQRNILKTHWASSMGCKENLQNKSRNACGKKHTKIKSDNWNIQ